MKGVAVTVIFEYGCSRHPRNIGNYPPNTRCHITGDRNICSKM